MLNSQTCRELGSFDAFARVLSARTAAEGPKNGAGGLVLPQNQRMPSAREDGRSRPMSSTLLRERWSRGTGAA